MELQHESKRSVTTIKYDLDEFFYAQADDTKLLAAINNDFSNINGSKDKWSSMYKMISSK